MDGSARKVYWPSALVLVGGGLWCLGLFLFGVGSVFDLPRSGPNLVFGILAWAVCIALAWHLINGKLVVTPDGISVWRRMRRRRIPWDSIRSFKVRPAGSRALISVVFVDVGSERFRVRGTERYTKRVNAIMADLNAARNRYSATRPSPRTRGSGSRPPAGQPAGRLAGRRGRARRRRSSSG